MKRTPVLLALVVLLLVTSSALAQQRDPAQYERVLVPIYAATSGAFGSQWVTQLTMANDSDRTVDAFPVSRDCNTSIGCYQSIREAPAFLPRMIGMVQADGSFVPMSIGVRPSTTPGVFLYVEKGAVDGMSFHLNVRGTTTSFGTQIPVVPEHNFLTGRRNILSVPITADSRAALRIYTDPERMPASVTVRVVEMAEHWVLGGTVPVIAGPARLLETHLDFTYDAANDGCSFFTCPQTPYRPATIEVTDLLRRYPQIATDMPVRIEIEPDDPTLPFWAMVTVTANGTNEMTLFTVR